MELVIALASAIWLGILTSISPCPMATNIAAISFIGQKVDKPRYVLWSGLFYTLGRALAYFALGCLIVTSLLATPLLSFYLQKYFHMFLGPLLILVGMFLMELIQVNFGNSRLQQWIQKYAESWGLWGAGALGLVFALSFCPISAAIFFGSLIPMAIQFQSGVVLPLIYGIGTALPVVVFAILVAMGARTLSKAYNRVSQAEWWARRITGGVFIIVGILSTLQQLF